MTAQGTHVTAADRLAHRRQNERGWWHDPTIERVRAWSSTVWLCVQC